MKLPHRFYKFPFRFDVARLVQEISLFPEEAWLAHANDIKGNSFLPLVSTRGEAFDDFDPPMLPTKFLEGSPYLRQVLGEFRTLIGRSRLMRLEPGHGVPLHFDSKQYWRSHTRIHVPIVTDPAIRFHCEETSVHMAAGEAWTFDNWRSHQVVNTTDTRRIHLTIDTYGSNAFWDMARPLGEDPRMPNYIPYRPNAPVKLLFESYVGEPVMSSAEVDLEFGELVADVQAFAGNDPESVEKLRLLTRTLRNEWRTIWHLMGPAADAMPHFEALAKWARSNAAALDPALKTASNGLVLAPSLAETINALVKSARQPAARSEPKFNRPVFIVSAPRSGSTWLYEMLAQSDAFHTLGGEGHQHVEAIEALQPRRRQFESNRLSANDATDAIANALRANYLIAMRDAAGRLLRDQTPRPQQIRFLEKTPKNALRIPFLRAVFPDAKFIFLHREGRANISAIMEAWRSGRFVTYPDLPGWRDLPWSLLLIPGWRDLVGARLEEIAMRQWRDTNQTILDDLAHLPDEDWCAVRYEDVKRDPNEALRHLCAFARIPSGDAVQKAAGKRADLSRYTLTPPDDQKWRKNEAEIETVFGSAAAIARRLAGLSTAASVGAAAQ